MPHDALAEARGWLARADQDLQVARLAQPVPAAVAYHAQQAGEKALKAFLAAHNSVFRPTHNLEELVVQCSAIDAGFGPLTTTAHTLTPYATRFRYPGGPLEPPAAEAQRALQLAEDLVRFVRGRLGI
jgi:HEPN domain-containing protein